MDQHGFTFPAQISIRPLPMAQMLRAPQRDRHEPPRTFPPFTSDEDIREKSTGPSPAYSNASMYQYQRRCQTAPYPRSTPSPSVETRQSGSYAHTRTSPRENHRHRDDRDDFTSKRSRTSGTLNTGNASYNIIKPLSEASDTNAGTYLIEDRLTKDLLVEKRLSVTTPFARERATAEVNALLQIHVAGNSNNIIKIYDTFYDGMADYSLVLEHCDHGTLGNFIDRYIRERKQCPEPFAWHVLESLCAALCLCHHGIRDPAVPMSRPPGWNTLCHFDIRPENIFLTSSHQQGFYPRIVLGSFACVATPEDCDSGLAEIVVYQSGNSKWLSPEMTPPSTRPVQGRSTDIWQTGAVIQCICRLLPFPDQGLVEEERPCGSRYSSTINNIITCCMTSDRKNRPTAVDLLKEITRVASQDERRRT